MKVFISWSGNKSRKLAEFLAAWLKKLPLTMDPWVSKDAIDPGTRWGKELSEALEGTSFGILCITSENQREAWISFEAGALSKTIVKTYVIPYLIGMTPSELEQPLKQFQAIEANEEGTWKLIKTIHMASGDKTRTINDLEESFKMWWPKLSDQIENAKNEVLDSINVTKEPSMSDIQFSLDKVLTVMESLSSRFTRLESERLSQWLENIRENLGMLLSKYGMMSDEISYLKNNINFRDIGIEKFIYELKDDPSFYKILIKALKEKNIDKLEEKDLDNDNQSKV